MQGAGVRTERLLKFGMVSYSLANTATIGSKLIRQKRAIAMPMAMRQRKALSWHGAGMIIRDRHYGTRSSQKGKQRTATGGHVPDRRAP